MNCGSKRAKRKPEPPREPPEVTQLCWIFERALYHTQHALDDARHVHGDEARAWALGKVWSDLFDSWVESLALLEDREPPRTATTAS